MSKITRRTLLAAAPVAVATGLLPYATAAEATIPTLDFLIRAHEEAYAAYNDACGRMMEVQNRVRQMPDIEVPIIIYPDGSAGERRDLGTLTEERIRQDVIARHAELRRIHCGSWSRRMAPDLVANLEAELQASETRAHAALALALEQRKAREIAVGLPKLEAAAEAMGVLEQAARLDLLLYRPKNPGEAKVKADYIDGSVPFIESWYGDDSFTLALINRLGEVE